MIDGPARGDEDLSPQTLGEALRLLGTLERMGGEHAQALAHKERAAEIHRAAGDRAREAVALGEIGTVHQALGRLEEARALHRTALAIHRSIENRRAEGIELSYLAVATHRLGRMSEARQLHQEALEIHRALGNRRYEAAERLHLGYVLHELGLHDEARTSFDEAVRLLREVGDSALEAVARTYRGGLEVDAGDISRAERDLDQALAAHRALGAARLVAETRLRLALAALARGDRPVASRAIEDALAEPDLHDGTLEGLLHAHRAWIHREAGEDEVARASSDVVVRIAPSVERPALRRAILLLAGGAVLAGDEEEARASSDLRRARTLLGVSGGRLSSAPGALSVDEASRLVLDLGPEARWVTPPGGERVDLQRRRALRLILLALAGAGGRPLAWQELLAAGWPGERMRTEAGIKRVYTAIWTLRRMGLEAVLVTRDDGYLVDPAVLVRQSEA